jgi:hypothetical protein
MPVSSILMSSLMGSGAGGGAGQGVANIAGGLVSGITGYFQKRKAKKLLQAAGEQPLYNIPQEILRNQKTAELNAQEGMPSQQYNNAMKNIQESQRNALSGAIDRRSALMALPGIQRTTNSAYGNLDAQSAQMRRQNQQTLYNVGNTTAQFRDKAWNTNELQPWQRKYNYGMQLLGTGNQNFTGGLEKFLGGVGQTAFPSGINLGGSKKTTPERDDFGAFQ